MGPVQFWHEKYTTSAQMLIEAFYVSPQLFKISLKQTCGRLNLYHILNTKDIYVCVSSTASNWRDGMCIFTWLHIVHVSSSVVMLIKS